MSMQKTSLGTRNAYGPRVRPETNAGIYTNTTNTMAFEVETAGTAADEVFISYPNNAAWVGEIEPSAVPTGLTVGLYGVKADLTRTVLVADAAFASTVFTTATTGIDAVVAGGLPKNGYVGYLLRFTGASAKGYLNFTVSVTTHTPNVSNA